MKRLMIMAAMSLAVVACGDDSGGDDDKGNEETPSKDAGRDAKIADAGKVDARGSSTGDDDNGDDVTDDDVTDDDVTDDDVVDAGKADATVADAGKGNDAGAANCALLTYASFGRAFEEKYCASCHAGSVKGAARGGAPADAVYDDLASFMSDKAMLKKEVVTEKSMPFGKAAPKPTDAERVQFGQFLDCGPK